MSWLTGWYNFLQDEVGTDDFVDKLNRRHVVTALALTTVVLAGSEYIGNPINCFTPNGYSENQVDFINSVCFTQSLYYAYNENWNQSQPLLGTHLAHRWNIPIRGARMVNYYKYAPIVLMLIAFFFVLPHYIWQVSLNQLSALNLGLIMGASTEMMKPISDTATDDQAESITDRLLQYASLERRSRPDDKADEKRALLMKRISSDSCVSRMGSFLASKLLPPGKCLFCSYIFIKMLYVTNVCLALWGLSVFLDVSPWDYPLKIIRGFRFDSEHGTQFSGRFPTVTICQYTGEAQVHGKLLRFSNLCVIPLNVYYDKVFAVFYCLFVVVLVMLVVSIFVWLYKCCGSKRLFLKYLDVEGPTTAGRSLKLLDSVATVDLIFMLRLIENNTDWLVTFSLIRKLSDQLASRSMKNNSVP